MASPNHRIIKPKCVLLPSPNSLIHKRKSKKEKTKSFYSPPNSLCYCRRRWGQWQCGWLYTSCIVSNHLTQHFPNKLLSTPRVLPIYIKNINNFSALNNTPLQLTGSNGSNGISGKSFLSFPIIRPRRRSNYNAIHFRSRLDVYKHQLLYSFF